MTQTITEVWTAIKVAAGIAYRAYAESRSAQAQGELPKAEAIVARIHARNTQ